MTTDSTKAMTPMQALAQIADGTGLSKHDMQDLAALAYNTAQRDAHLAPREVTVSDESTVLRAREWHQEQADLSNLHGFNKQRDFHRIAVIALESFALQAGRQRGGGVVPDEMTTHDLGGFGAMDERERGYVDGWNAYRKAILDQRGQVREGWSWPEMKENVPHVRWIVDGKIYGRPTLSDLLSVIQEMKDAAPDADVEGKGNG